MTLSNLFCGLLAVVLAVRNQLEMAALFVMLGIVFDFFDGFAARMLKVESPLGVELDSLADMVTFGVVPGIVMFQLLSKTMGYSVFSWEASDEYVRGFWGWYDQFYLLPLLGFLISLCSAYRLANFNTDENQVSSFVGLPTPANALLVLSLPLILRYQGSDLINALILNKWFLVVFTLVSAWLLNSPLKLFALKFKSFAFRGNAIRYTFLLLSLLFIPIFRFLAIPLIIVMYLLLSGVEHQLKKEKA